MAIAMPIDEDALRNFAGLVGVTLEEPELRQVSLLLSALEGDMIHVHSQDAGSSPPDGGHGSVGNANSSR